jgi:hypothetical protein
VNDEEYREHLAWVNAWTDSKYSRKPLKASDWAKDQPKPDLPSPPLGYTDNMPKGLGNAMRETKATRTWLAELKKNRLAPFSGMGLGINIQKKGEEFVLNITALNGNQEFYYQDTFELAEAIQEAVEEFYS